jgi:HAD superfamily hydrolase (TIGR01509 family)
MTIRALIFDFDGLILDTELPEFRSWEEVYAAHGCALAFDDWAACIGTADLVFSPYDDLEAKLGRPLDRAAIRAARRARWDELILAEAALPGVVGYIDDARAMGLRLAVASSSTREWVVGHLTRLGLIDAFDCVKCSDDVERTKPDPALYRAALAALGLRPEEAIVFEDSPNGVLAAKRAGLYCVAIPNALTGRLPLDHADRRLVSLADLPLATLLAEVERDLIGRDGT